MLFRSMTGIEILNIALSHLGIRAKIQAFDEDSVEANACRTHWDGLRDLSLRLHDWNFARVTVRLTALTDPADPEGLVPARRWAGRHPCRLPVLFGLPDHAVDRRGRADGQDQRRQV